MYCSRCGKEIAEGAAFCIHCGLPVANADGTVGEDPKRYATPEPETDYDDEVAYEQMLAEVDRREKRSLKLSMLCGLFAGIGYALYGLSSMTDEVLFVKIISFLLLFLLTAYVGTAMIYGGGRVEKEMKRRHILGNWSVIGCSVFGWCVVALLYTALSGFILAIGGFIYMYKLPYCFVCMITKKPIVGKNMTYDELVDYAHQNRIITLIVLVVFAFVLIKQSPIGNGELENKLQSTIDGALTGKNTNEAVEILPEIENGQFSDFAVQVGDVVLKIDLSMTPKDVYDALKTSKYNINLNGEENVKEGYTKVNEVYLTRKLACKLIWVNTDELEGWNYFADGTKISGVRLASVEIENIKFCHVAGMMDEKEVSRKTKSEMTQYLADIGYIKVKDTLFARRMNGGMLVFESEEDFDILHLNNHFIDDGADTLTIFSVVPITEAVTSTGEERLGVSSYLCEGIRYVAVRSQRYHYNDDGTLKYIETIHGYVTDDMEKPYNGGYLLLPVIW